MVSTPYSLSSPQVSKWSSCADWASSCTVDVSSLMLIPADAVRKRHGLCAVSTLSRTYLHTIAAYPHSAPPTLPPPRTPLPPQTFAPREHATTNDIVETFFLTMLNATRRKLLCDRKDPFAHLSPRRLTLTVLRSGLVVAAPMMNEVILDSVEDMVITLRALLAGGFFVVVAP